MLQLVIRGLIGGLVQVALYGVALLVPAGLVPGGTWYWSRALIFLAVYAVALEAFVLFLAVVAPASLRARVTAPASKEQPRADRIATAFLVLATLAWFVFVPLDVFVWHLLPAPSAGVSDLGAVIALIGFVVIMVAIHQNAFAIPIVEDQTHRDQDLDEAELCQRQPRTGHAV